MLVARINGAGSPMVAPLRKAGLAMSPCTSPVLNAGPTFSPAEWNALAWPRARYQQSADLLTERELAQAQAGAVTGPVAAGAVPNTSARFRGSRRT